MTCEEGICVIGTNAIQFCLLHRNVSPLAWEGQGSAIKLKRGYVPLAGQMWAEGHICCGAPCVWRRSTRTCTGQDIVERPRHYSSWLHMRSVCPFKWSSHTTHS